MSSPILPPNFDYELPGDIANPNALKVRHRMLQVGYSRRLNPRLLEYIFYAPWNNLFSSLVYDNPDFLLVPQHAIYREREDESLPAKSNVSAMTKPLGLKNLDIRTPDFGILRVAATPDNVTPPWDELSIQSHFVCLLSEIKRPPSRAFSSPIRFTKSLLAKLDAAQSELYRAAAILFANTKLDHPPNSIILVAVSGEWYAWTELFRSHFPVEMEFRRNWFLKVWPTRDLHLKPGNRKRAKKTPQIQKIAQGEDDKNLGADKDKNISINDKEDGSDEDDASGKEEDDSPKERDDFDEAGDDNDEKEDVSEVEDIAAFDEDGSDEEDPNNRESEGFGNQHIFDNSEYLDDESVGERRASDSEFSDVEIVEKTEITEKPKPLITEYHHSILDSEDPDLEQLRNTEYQTISEKRGEPIKLAQAKWTKAIRLGTPVSNQHLAAIRERLEAIKPKTTRNVTKSKATDSTTKPKATRSETKSKRSLRPRTQ
ncbi:hypothetical protein HYPSUDRAFT_75222 [Hypholoma sublateritium FD-334 SS-4]|uniref:Uncharacterized protein n=1 Tax=Hypholoma sublateritium (strain FD-334 SS-4) TaxID=945553 RepID=A0A0D2MS49_HYPSF|nr:hypothetical protein HYPSUDRAFT_75222 [Hypholoma sublateritium FD-334 SS-4]